jgi:hypothetical protein
MFGKTQRRVVGVMSGLQQHNYKERLKKLGMTTLAERRHYVDMHIVYNWGITVDPFNIRPREWAGWRSGGTSSIAGNR